MNAPVAHPAAEIFPLMDGKRFAELVESIREHGLLHPVVLHGGAILDGRNRHRACMEAGRESRFVDYAGDPFAYVWNANGQRRDIGNDQRYLIWKMANECSAEWQAKAAAVRAEGDRKRSEATKAQPRTEDGLFDTGAATTSGRTRSPRGPGKAAKGAAAGTNRGSAERMDTLATRRPDLAESVRLGDMKPTAAMREMKKDEVSAKVADLPADIFRVFYADPPWQYNDDRGGLGSGDGQGGADFASTAARNHYPTMSKADLCALDVGALSAADAVLFCWATFPLLPDAIEVVRAWGFKYKTAFVWDKGKGSFGHYHKAEAELLLVCTKGSCTPDSDERENQVQRWPRGAHSRKPAEAAEMISRLYPHGPRIELFCRGKPQPGWVGWGAEVADVEDAA